MSTPSHPDSAVSGFATLARPFLDAESNQLNAWLRFQESLATFYKDLWEQWAVRFAGGAPIDR